MFLEKLWDEFKKCVIKCVDKAKEAINQVRTVKAYDCIQLKPKLNRIGHTFIDFIIIY